jgi:hypothetical protein
MPAQWKTVRIFISSTFRDMQAERDHLVTVVFPELRERIEQLGLEFFDVDLRWGDTSIRTEYTFTDMDIATGCTYAYSLSDVRADGAVRAYPPLDIQVDALPEIKAMEMAYPNPFNPTTFISYQLSKDGPWKSRYSTSWAAK